MSVSCSSFTFAACIGVQRMKWSPSRWAQTQSGDAHPLMRARPTDVSSASPAPMP